MSGFLQGVIFVLFLLECFICLKTDLGCAYGGEVSESSSSRSKVEEVETTYEDLALPTERRVLIPMSEQDTLSRKKSPFSFNFFNWTTVDAQAYRQGDARFSSYNFIGIDYRLNYDSKLSFRPVFFLSSSGKNFFGEQVDSEIDLGDPYLQYSHYNLALLPGDVGLFGAFRLFLPMSKYSKENKTLARTQLRLIMTKPLARGIELSYHSYPSYAFYARRGTTTYFGNPKGNEQAELEHFLELNEAVTTQFALSQRAGITHKWFYDVPSKGIEARRDEFLNLSLMASYSVSSINFRAGVINDIKLREYKTASEEKRKRSLELFREEELQYSLMTYVRF
ncbi:MAG: hypothetical protein KDD35_01785 [Bdellovibrionales bacterium]|nr:hypothetical protein [Bdellovibrionales bacterium]